MFNRRIRRGFTLVELMVVMVIIAILAAIITPVAFRVIDSAKNTSMKMEINGLAQAVEAYKLKHGDYPPDFTNWRVVRDHYKQAFPRIQNGDLQLLVELMYPGQGLSVTGTIPTAPQATGISHAEALVLTLGGYSDDPTAPLSGEGGPFSRTAGGDWQYNPDRSNAFFDFEDNRMYLELGQDGDGNPKTVSREEGVLGGPQGNDILPVYHPNGQQVPYAYFDSRTYAYAGTDADQNTVAVFSAYNPGNVDGAARPYKSNQMNTQNVPGSLPEELQQDRAAYYMNRESFQIISAGLDDAFGGDGQTASGRPVLFMYPTGDSFHPEQNFSNYSTGGAVNGQLDNIANFTEGATLDNDLP